MAGSENVQALKAIAEAAKERNAAGSQKRVASVRVSPGGYLATASVLSFASALLLHSNEYAWALALLAVAWVFIPILAFTDRLVFDGRSLTRRGIVPFIFQLISGTQTRIGINDFEKVTTNAVRTLRRGGRVRYRYRSQVSGKGINLALVSGG